MYKFTYTANFVRYHINNKLEELIEKNKEDILKNIEYSLLQNAYKEEIEKSNLKEKYSDIQQIQEDLKYELIKQRIKQISKNTKLKKIIEISQKESKLILIELYEFLLNKEMQQKENINLVETDKKKLSKETPKQTLEDFIESKDSRDYVSNLKQEISKILSNKDLTEKYYIDRPTYFLLYRIRNNIIKEEKNKRLCSQKYIESAIKDLEAINKESIFDEINSKNIDKIENLEEINIKIYEYMIQNLINTLDRTAEFQSEERRKKLKEAINAKSEIIEIRKQYIKKSANNYNYLKQKENIQDTFNQVIEIVCNMVKEHKYLSKKYLRQELEEYTRVTYSNAIFDIENQEINIDYDVINKKTIRELEKKYIRKTKYDILIPLKNIKLQTDLTNINGITILSGERLGEKIDLKEQERNFNFKVEQQGVYALVENIEVLDGDWTRAVEKAESKIENTVAIIENYTYRKQNKKIQFSVERYVLKNKNITIISYPFSNNAVLDIKIFQDEKIDKIFQIQDEEKLNTISKSLNELYNLNNKSIRSLKNCYYELYDTKDIKDNALFFTTLIAGTNIYRYDDISYLKLRLWLYEDYLEMLNDEIENDKFVFDRFFKFNRTVITTLLSYMENCNEDIEKNIQNWILKVYPNDYSRRLI